MSSRSLVLTAALTVTACGGSGTTPITLGGHTLQPGSTALYSIGFGSFGVTEALISDVPDVCGKLGAIDTCTLSNGNPFAVDGNTLVLEMPGITPATYAIGNLFSFDGGSGGFDGGFGSFGAQAIFTSFSGGQSTFGDVATSGSITLDAINASDSATGHYDLSMRSGGHITGTFKVAYCAALGALASGRPQCGVPSNTSSTCSESCTCKGKSVSADCTQNDAGTGYDCTCTSSTGAKTTCSNTSSAPPSFACYQGETCCPLSF